MERVRLEVVGKQYFRLQRMDFLSNNRRRQGEKSRWFWSVKDVSLLLEGGQWLGVVGANGSGKTTLLRIIAGVTAPTHGTVVVNGRIVSLLELFAGMQSDLTGRENIFLNGLLLGMRRHEIRRKFNSIVEFAGIGDFLDMPLKHYSTGMAMRIGFSVGLHVEAQIFLIDEAWSVGDSAFQEKSLGRLLSLSRQGAGVILVTHDLGIIRKYATETLWLDRGSVAGFGGSGPILQSYLRSNLP